MLLLQNEFEGEGRMKVKTLIFGIIGVLLFIQPITAQTWGSAKRLTWNSGSSSEAAIAVDSNNHIHVAWSDETPGNFEIYFKKSTDGGAKWAIKRLTWNSGPSRSPAIAIDSNDHIHLVWDDNSSGYYEIYYKKSTDGGANWTFKRLTWNFAYSYDPAIAIDSNGHIHLVWYDYDSGNKDVSYKKSTDGGATWTTKRLTWNSGSWYPAIAVGSNNHIHVVWNDSTPGNEEIYYKKSTDGGTTWTTKRLTSNSGDSEYPDITVDSSNHIHVVWFDNTPGNAEIYYSQSTDGGTTWSQKRLTWNIGDSEYPAITADSNSYIHVIWEDELATDEIFYKRSTNGGASWTTKRLTWNTGLSQFPDIVTDSLNNIHVVWGDSSSGNFEIFYKKGIQ
jgi:hypothetical protein